MRKDARLVSTCSAMTQNITKPSPTFGKFNPSHHISKTSSYHINYGQAVSMSRSAVDVSSNTQEGDFNTIVTNLANQDKVPWYQKRNLRSLYFMLIPTCMGIQMTSGFHAQMVNAMQILPSWISCMLIYLYPMIYADEYDICRLWQSPRISEGNHCSCIPSGCHSVTTLDTYYQ